MASFSVVALMKEDAAIIRRFIDFYLRIGAERVFIYHDGPIGHLVADGLDPAALALRGVDLIGCDEAFWRRETGQVPADIQQRLRAAFALGHARCTSDWLFICDADEFIFVRTPVAEVLAAVPSGVDAVGLGVAEAVWGPGEDIATPFGSTWFRRPGPRGRRSHLEALRLYGPLGLLFRRGILSHVGGKQFVRTRARFDEIRQHHSTRDGARVTVPLHEAVPTLPVALELAHFDAISLGRWRTKFERRKHDSAAAMRERSFQRRWQIYLFRWMSALGPAALAALFRGFYLLSPRQIARLETRGLAFQADIFGGASATGHSAKSRA